MLRYLTAGHSYGQALVTIVEGLPAGLAVTVEDLQGELARRRLGYGRGPRMRFEADEATLRGGVRHGRTLGSPVAIEVEVTPSGSAPTSGTAEMSPLRRVATAAPLTQPRPGHADLAGMQKYGFGDARDVLERASARETAALFAAGTMGQAAPGRAGHPGRVARDPDGAGAHEVHGRPGAGDLERVDASPVRCFDPAAEEAMVEQVEAAAKVGDSLGGIVEVLAYGVPVGLGQPRALGPQARQPPGPGADEHPGGEGRRDRRRLRGGRSTGLGGPRPHQLGRRGRPYRRETPLAGGVEGGMSTGEPVVARVAMKPLATLNRPTLRTVDVVTKAETVSFKERTDVTAVPAMGVVAETMVALVLAGEALRKFGGDSVAEWCATTTPRRLPWLSPA